ncbi:hypothetical protein [Phytohalomonas tamaricis]|uniref:hypothetical protein n=1 Tax=Phytohalomonas tamaricis TaxID=2081032 RepID=UPI000D0B833B|nr:hypothetical protein [Phytohalomonas tamaricis]
MHVNELYVSEITDLTNGTGIVVFVDDDEGFKDDMEIPGITRREVISQIGPLPINLGNVLIEDWQEVVGILIDL